MRIIEAIAQEHAEEAAFLWLLRDRSVIGIQPLPPAFSQSGSVGGFSPGSDARR